MLITVRNSIIIIILHAIHLEEIISNFFKPITYLLPKKKKSISFAFFINQIQQNDIAHIAIKLKDTKKIIGNMNKLGKPELEILLPRWLRW